MKQEQPLSWEEIDRVIACSSRPVLLYGPPATGKTHAAFGNGAVDVLSLTLTPETPAAELRGHYLPRGGDFVWHNGPLTDGWVNPCRVVLNEIDKASADTLVYLYAFLDDTNLARITLPSGVTIRPTPGFQCIATMNGNPSDLPEALRSRFAVQIAISTVHPDAYNTIDDVYLRRLAMQSAIDAQGVKPDDATSIRQWQSVESLRKTVELDLALRAVFGARGCDFHTAYTLLANE